jgi:hypothetical protein
MSSMPDAPPGPPAGWSCRYSKNQTAIFAPLTTVSRPHHQDRGFDQAKESDEEFDDEFDREFDRVRHSKLMGRSKCN